MLAAHYLGIAAHTVGASLAVVAVARTRPRGRQRAALAGFNSRVDDWGIRP